MGYLISEHLDGHREQLALDEAVRPVELLAARLPNRGSDETVAMTKPRQSGVAIRSCNQEWQSMAISGALVHAIPCPP